MLLILNVSTVTTITRKSFVLPQSRFNSQRMCPQTKSTYITYNMLREIKVEVSRQSSSRPELVNKRRSKPSLVRSKFVGLLPRVISFYGPPYFLVAKAKISNKFIQGDWPAF